MVVAVAWDSHRKQHKKLIGV